MYFGSQNRAALGPRIAHPHRTMRIDAAKRERERKTIETMVALYCRDFHSPAGGLCPECDELRAYALLRLERCPYGDGKPTCAKCAIHCYKPAARERIREVMRYAGPRMLLHRPILTVRHMLAERKTAPAPRRLG